MDFRDVAGHYRSVFENVDTRRLRATFTVMGEDGEEVAHDVRLKFEVCDTCEGKGVYVNPSIDAHGLTRDDFDADPDFEEDYVNHRFDVPCAICRGERLVPVIDEEANPKELVALVQAREQDAWDDARQETREREMGY